MRCIAHRGGPRAHSGEENTASAISRALAAGVSIIEVDVWLVNGELLVVHDCRLGRLIKGRGYLWDYTLAQLRTLAAQSGTEIPRLVDLLPLLWPGTRLNIELKGTLGAAQLCTTLAQAIATGVVTLDQLLVSAFDHRQLGHCRAQMPELERGALWVGAASDLAAVVKSLAPRFIGVQMEFVDAALVAAIHAEGVEVWAYTANHTDEFKRLKEIGVDAVFTDQPESLLAFLAERSGNI